MTEKTICSEYTDAEQNQTTEITITDFLKKQMKLFDILLRVINEYDSSLVEDALLNYKKTLEKMTINPEKNILTNRLSIDYSEFLLITKYSKFISLIENAVLFFLNFTNYEKQRSNENKIAVLITDVIRAGFHPLYYLAYSLIDLTSREVTHELAKKFVDYYLELVKDIIPKYEKIEDYANSLYKGLCPKSQNSVRFVQDGKFYLKVTRCMEAEVFSDLPDIKLASFMECYGDFSSTFYKNPNFVLSRTKTLVEGHPYCDFVFYDKRNETKIEHPDEEFWKNF